MNCDNQSGISIIVTYYNNGNFFPEFYRSFCKLELNIRHELIIVDNGSDDNSYLDAYTDIIGIRIIKQQSNTGVQSARNTGLANASFQFVMMMDGDDKFSDESNRFIIDAVTCLKKNNNVAFVHGLAYMFDKFSGYTISSYPLSPSLIAQMHHVPTSIVYRTKEALKVGGYDISINKWQDWAFGVALLYQKMQETDDFQIAYIPRKAILYRVSNNKTRLSNKPSCLVEEIKKTVDLYYEFFLRYYTEDRKQIPQIISEMKPSRLVELLHVALYDYKLATQIINERNYDVNHPTDKYWIP